LYHQIGFILVSFYGNFPHWKKTKQLEPVMTKEAVPTADGMFPTAWSF